MAPTNQPAATGAPQLTPVPFDAEIAPILEFMAQNPQPPMTEETLPLMRGGGPGFPAAAEVATTYGVTTREIVIAGPGGDIELTVFAPASPASDALPVLVNYHGGGMIVGHRSWEHGRVADLVARHGVVGVNVEYRLAPEHPYPAGVEDNYAAALWVANNAAAIGADADRLIVMGGSAGGAFAAAVSLMARDRGAPAIAGQLLLCPMLDNTNSSVASKQYDGIGTWQRDANLLAWRCVLGPELAYSADAPAYAAPAHAESLAGLPPAFIEAGAAEMFRDEDTEYATRIWRVGGDAELHVWAGGFHGFDMYAPETKIARAALSARDSWLERVLGLDKAPEATPMAGGFGDQTGDAA